MDRGEIETYLVAHMRDKESIGVLVVVDEDADSAIKMPEMDGFALLKQLLDSRPDLPVLALSGYIEEEEAQTHRFNGFFPKPLRVDEFRQLVEATLSKE